MSWGKHFGSMYSGSMVGAGAMVFAVWGYVIANMRPEARKPGASMIVELNPKLLGPILGEPPEAVREAIAFLCAPDKESRSQEQDGRRLIEHGAFLYTVVNGAFYRAILDEDGRKEQLRLSQARFRAKRLRKARPGAGESLAVRAEKNGTATTGEIADQVNQERNGADI